VTVARIVVTGATGFVGGRIAARLRDRGDEVVALGRRRSDDLAAMGAEQELVDLTDTAALEAVLERHGPVDGLVHAAATAGPDLDEVRVVNRDVTRALVDAALATGRPRFVHLSTTSVYDLEAIGDAEVDEDAPLVTAASWPDGDPVPYSLTKAEAEGEVQRAVAAGLSAQILRPPAVLGVGPSSTWGTRVPRRYRDGELPPRAPATTFAYVDVEDLVDVVLASLEARSTATCNVVGGHTTFGDYLRALRQAMPAPPAYEAASPEVPWRGRYATRRLAAELGVTPSRSFEGAMERIVDAWAGGDPGAR
jgi:2-alkyl-3-oxoalkanoate reductase